MAAIELRNVVKRYDLDLAAVNDISLEVSDGEFMVLVGPSGCGKTSLLRMIAGLEAVTEGDILFGDEVVTAVASSNRNVAMVFQNYSLYQHLSVYDNIAFPLRTTKSFSEREIDFKVREASRLLKLDDQLQRQPAGLSGGQRQRVALARAIVRDAQAFLFDEPLANLEARLRSQMRVEIAWLQRRLGVTTVYVTHDQTEAMTLGDRVAVIDAGRLQQVAPPRELYEQPANLFVAGFMGSPPMTILPASVHGETADLPFGQVPIGSVKAQMLRGRRLVLAGVRPEHAGEGVDSSQAPHLVRVPLEGPDVLDSMEMFERDLLGGSWRTELLGSLDLPSRLAHGRLTELHVDTRKIHFFDPVSGRNLTMSS